MHGQAMTAEDTRAGSAEEGKTGFGPAQRDNSDTNATFSTHDAIANPRLDGWKPRLDPAEARIMSRMSRYVVLALQDGARSARAGDTSGLSYADGWSAAATLAQLVTFDALRSQSE